MFQRQFANGWTIEIFQGHTCIKDQEGHSILGAPEDTDDYRATAKKFGYDGDILLLCQEHELMHLALAEWLHFESPTMRSLIAHTDDNMEIRGLEEDAVLAIQKLARALDINLITLFTEKTYINQ